MAGTWLLGERKVRPGTYFRVSSGDITTVGAVNGIAAVLFKSNWGELNKVTEVVSSDMNNLKHMFGDGDGVNAIKEALLGGATTVKAVRVGNETTGTYQKLYIHAPRKNATRKVLVTVASNGIADFLTDKMTSVEERLSYAVRVGDWDGPTAKLVKGTDYTLVETKKSKSYTKREIHLTESGFEKLNAAGEKRLRIYEYYKAAAERVAQIYARCRGGREFTCSLNTNLVTGKRQMIFYTGTEIFDSVSFEAGGNETQALKDALDTNKNFKVFKIYKASVIADFTGRAMSGGSNPTVAVSDYSKGTDVLERHYWNVLLADSNSVSVSRMLTEYIKQSYEMGRLGMTVIGASAASTVEKRMEYATALNDWRVVYVANGWKDINGTKYSGWRAAARIGGMIAGCETNASLTHIVISNATELLNPMTNGEMIQAEQKGCLCLSLNDDGQIWIDNAINTLITLGNDQDEGWKKIRRTKCRFELMTRCNRTCDKYIGRLNNDANGRATLITAMQSIINEMIAEGKLFFGSYVAEDTRYSPDGDRAYFVLYISDIDSIEKVYLDFNFTYANRFE